jgi:hypothetical protein
MRLDQGLSSYAGLGTRRQTAMILASSVFEGEYLPGKFL